LTAALSTPQQIEVDTRYHWITQVVEATVRQPLVAKQTWSDRIDQIVTHKVWGLGIFLVTMAVTFQAIFSWAVPVMDGIDSFFSIVGSWVGGLFPEGPLQSLVVDGLIGGVGAVVIFVPQIALLFGLIAILEDSGYMARAAFLMDRIMASFGLSGRSFIPLLSSFACAVPGIMSTRSIDNHRDRLATILIAPLMSCSARLPVYVLFIAAFIPSLTVGGIFGLQGLTLFFLYLVGVIVAPPIAWLLKRTMLKGEAVPFLLELPPFQIPAWRVVLFRMYDRSLAFLKRAGTIILATTILVWALSYYPNQERVAKEFQTRRATASAEELAQLDIEEAGTRLRESYLGQAGHAIAPLVRPLGWDWKIGMATLASFPAREVIIAALGTIYNLGNEQNEESMQLRDAMRAERWPDGRPVYTPLVALSIMVFFALCCQCGATLATIKRETGSWGYAAFTFIYMTSLAYLSALLVYQIGSRLTGA
jgi:ferrous iron transport protein B